MEAPRLKSRFVQGLDEKTTTRLWSGGQRIKSRYMKGLGEKAEVDGGRTGK